LQVIEDPEVVAAQHRFVPGKGKDDDSQAGEQNNMDSSVDGDGPKDIAISEGAATQWKLDLIALGWVLLRGLPWGNKREP
jgi:hypothetical protein